MTDINDINSAADAAPELQPSAIYNYDRATGLYLGQAQADPDPLQPGQWLMPANATPDAPPLAAAGQVAVYTDVRGWQLAQDHRGTWYKADGQAVQIDDLRADISGMTRSAPPSPDHVLINDEWVLSQARVAARFNVYKDQQFAAMRAQREVVINRLLGIAFAADKSNDTATVQGCLTARLSLLNLTKHASILAATTEADLKAAFKAVYGGIVAACPSNIRNAFVGISA